MKASFILCFLIYFCSCVSQKQNVTLYGYKQAVVSGVRTSNNSIGSGGLGNGTKPYFNYFIYLTHTPSKKIRPSEIWMNGNPFDVQIDTVETPVEMVFADNPLAAEKQILVPKTSDVVLRISLQEKTPGKTTNAKSLMLKSNELVLVYEKDGKFYSEGLEKINSLRTALMQ